LIQVAQLPTSTQVYSWSRWLNWLTAMRLHPEGSRRGWRDSETWMKTPAHLACDLHYILSFPYFIFVLIPTTSTNASASTCDQLEPTSAVCAMYSTLWQHWHCVLGPCAQPIQHLALFPSTSGLSGRMWNWPTCWQLHIPGNTHGTSWAPCAWCRSSPHPHAQDVSWAHTL
jgi:hypothetical protein